MAEPKIRLMLADVDGTLVTQDKVLPSDLVKPTIELMMSFGLEVWLYRGADFL